MSPLFSLSPQEQHQFFVANVPHVDTLGMRVIRVAPEQLIFDLPFAPHLADAAGGIHEGALFTLLDSALGSAALTQLDEVRRTATLDLRMDVLRRATPGRGLRCEAVSRITQDVAFQSGLIHDGNPDDPVALASGSFAVFRGKPGPAADLAPTLPAAARVQPASPHPACANAYAQTLGIACDLDAGHTRGHMPYSQGNVGNASVPALHGGSLASLLQLTATAELMRTLDIARVPRLMSLYVEYLSAAQLQDSYASATVVSLSRRFANLRVQAWQQPRDRPVTVATVQFLLTE